MTNQKIQIKLEPKSIAACDLLPPELAFMGNALQHQADVFEKSRDHDIILDLAPTGTGKTKAGLSVLLHQPDKSAVYIAPTNALITQQVEAAKKFVKDAGLNHIVKPASARDIQAWPKDKVGKRRGEKLYNFLRNPATIFPEIGANKPILLVTNPDIFYYATFFAYNKLDRSNIASEFYSKFVVVIFDEFHLYDAKQLVGLFFYLALSHVFGFFQNGRRVVLLTATPEKACKAALASLQAQGVKIATIDGEDKTSSLLPSQTAVNLEIRPQPEKEKWLIELANEVEKRIKSQSNCNGAVILDSKDAINRLRDLLKAKGLENYYGRITGSTPQRERKIAAEAQVILATSTIDVGFNFERKNPPPRQNLDWLIFAARDRFCFWQRLGRVGRVLGKINTDIPSEAIAYLPEIAWEQGLTSLDCLGGRKAIQEMLENLPCLDRPFLEIYWHSEAFLEIARPLLELEESLESLPQVSLIPQLYASLQSIFYGKYNWEYYRYRMRVLRGAETIAKTSVKSLKSQWKYIKGGQAFFNTFLKANYPEEWEDLNANRTTFEEYEQLLKEDIEVAQELKQFAEIWTASYAPLFQFRDSLFNTLQIRDPHGFLLDELEETVLDPMHLLRYYDFLQSDDYIELVNRAYPIYELSFYLRYFDNSEDFNNKELNKLTAFANCRIERKKDDAIAPTPLLKELEKKLIPGVIVSTTVNQGIIIKLSKQGIGSYPITVSCNDFEKEYTFFPGLAGILAMATSGVKLKLPDDQEFYIA